MSPLAERQDYNISIFFGVEIDGMVAAFFTKVEGISLKRKVIEYHEGGDNSSPRYFPGHAVQSEITFTRGVIESNYLFNWLYDSIESNEPVDRKSGSIILYNDSMESVKRWNFRRAFPVNWKLSGLTTDQTECMVETLTLVHEGIEVVED
jgi:phage tail-like protein